MKKYMLHSMSSSEYIGIVTILDYEIQLSAYLSKLVFPSEAYGKKVIVDLALKTGIDEYRFVAFDVNSLGRLVLNSNNYVNVPEEIKKEANYFFKAKRDIVLNSFLNDKQKEKILCN